MKTNKGTTAAPFITILAAAVWHRYAEVRSAIWLVKLHSDVFGNLLDRRFHKPEKTAIHTGKILVMDDEEMIRNLAKHVLKRCGYDAELAKDGVEAIGLYRKAMDSGKPFDAVILDLTVNGGKGGKETVKTLLEINPQVKAIVSSGYSNDPVMTDFKKYGFIEALPKPYSMKDLSHALNKVTTGKS